MSLKSDLFTIVNRVPYSKVAYYGQIAEALSLEFDRHIRAQIVGWVLSGMTITEYDICPWHRIVAKTGAIAALKLGSKGHLQIELLNKEGVKIIDNTADMKKYCVQITDLTTFSSDLRTSMNFTQDLF